MSQSQKRKRSVSESLYPAHNENKKQKHIMQAIQNKDKTISALVKQLQPRLMHSFDDYRSLFWILDKNHDYVVTKEEWLSFSLGNSYLDQTPRRAKKKRRKRGKSSRSSRVSKLTHQQAKLKRKRSSSVLGKGEKTKSSFPPSSTTTLPPLTNISNLSSPAPLTPRNSFNHAKSILAARATPNLQLNYGIASPNSVGIGTTPTPNGVKQTRPSFRASTSMKIFCKFDLDALDEEKETSGGGGELVDNYRTSDMAQRKSFMTSVQKARSSYNESTDGMMAVGKSVEIVHRDTDFKKKEMKDSNSKKARISRKRLGRTRSKSLAEAMTMREVMEAEFNQIDLDGNGVIDQFEFCVFFMTHDLGVQWTAQQTKYRMNLYNNLLKTVGPNRGDAVKNAILTTEWLESRILESKHQSKLYSLWEFIYAHFGGEVKHVSLLGKKRVSSVEVLTWFIALNFDPLANVKDTGSKLPYCPSLSGSKENSRPTSGRKRSSRGSRKGKSEKKEEGIQSTQLLEATARLTLLKESEEFASANFPRKSLSQMHIRPRPRSKSGI